METLKINLDLSPAERWAFLADYKAEIDELIGYYLNDLGDVSFFENVIDHYKANFVKSSYLEEIVCIAKISEFSSNQILISNLYYDALKFVFGCTAFTVQDGKTPLHARNLDWWTENDALKKYSRIFDFEKDGKVLYSGIGWLGFIGILSGIRKGGYSVTLNAVLSDESPNLAQPITFLIRDVLEEEAEYDKAVERLSQTKIASDCLLMVVGTKSEQMTVIERTPTRYALRKPENGMLVVANDYKTLTSEKQTGDVLQQSSCGRYDRTRELVNLYQPQTEEDYMKILKDKQVKMNITVQQMILNPEKGTIWLGDVPS
ncbi:MAG: hypothetical protein H7Y04_16195 [Verrucomicrobia bacterium]|nr:hypothetical protein [Cytophagales bacterium]